MTATKNQKRIVVEAVQSSWFTKEPTEFPLYNKTDEGRFAVYCKPGESLPPLAPAQLYISTEHRPLLDRYLSNESQFYIHRADVPLKEKSRYLYSSASKVLERFFGDPTQEACLSCASDLAKSSMDLIAGEPSAFSSLLQVTSHDYHTFSHSVDVMLYAAGLSQKVGLDAKTAKECATGAILHDIGKSHIPAEIINKNGKLTDEEFARVKAHPTLGHTMLSDTDAEAIVHAVVYHHERYNGGGYPYGLSAEEIPMVAQIVTIADVFAALTTKRSYKPALNSFKALAIMKEHMSGHFNPDLFKAFVHLMGSQKAAA